MAIIEHTSGSKVNISPKGKFAVMFHLPGHCAGCKVALKILEGKKLENVTVLLIDAGDDANSSIVKAFEATTAPTVIVYENGNVIGRMAGLREFNEKQQFLLGD